MENYIVYCHTNTVNGKRYIGLTSQTLEGRSRNNGIGYRECPAFYRAIGKYGWDNFKHDILFQDLTKEEAEQKEIEMIAYYKSNNHEYGYNIQNGGNTNGTMSEETKQKISAAQKGKKLTEEHKKKIGLAQMGELNHQYGKKQRKETIEKRRMWNLQHPNKSQFPSHKVKQIDKEGNLVKIWGSMSEITRELGIGHSMISDCCNGKQKTCRGYIWQYCV